MRRIAPALLLALTALRAGEVVDRIALTVDKEIITLSQILHEMRISAFQDDKPLDFSAAGKRAAADQLLDRTLVNLEMDINRFSPVDRSDAEAELEKSKKRFAGAAAYEAALRKYGITEEDLLDRLQSQLTVLNFLEFRFQITEPAAAADVEKYYKETFVPLARKSGAKEILPLEQVRDQIEQVLAREKTNAAIEEWLGKARTRGPIRYHEGAFNE